MTYQPGPYDQSQPPRYSPQPQPPVTPGPSWPPQAQHPPTGWPPQPAPPKKRGPLTWILGGVGVIVGLCLVFGIIGALTGGSDKANDSAADLPAADTATKTTETKAAKAPAKKAPGIGSKVRDGKFEFVVTGVDCSKTKVGDQYLNTTAQGRFCIVSVTVTNIGDEPRTFTGGSQKAFAGKIEYSNDGEAELYLNSNSQTFLQDVNPGNSVKGKLVFDVPKSTKLTEIELHDGVFSGGVRVAL